MQYGCVNVRASQDGSQKFSLYNNIAAAPTIALSSDAPTLTHPYCTHYDLYDAYITVSQHRTPAELFDGPTIVPLPYT